MTDQIILASGSAIRRQLLQNAKLKFISQVSDVDEVAILVAAHTQGLGPGQIAQILAEKKAEAIWRRNPNAVVIGCDQVLEHRGTLLSKAKDKKQAFDQIKMLSGKSHRLFSAVSVFENGELVWSHVGMAELVMRELVGDEIDNYLSRNWATVRHCVGCYELEKEGPWLFTKVDGDYFTVLGLPLIQLLGYLSSRGVNPE